MAILKLLMFLLLYKVLGKTGMGIWHTLKDLTTDRKGFHAWEQSQEDTDAKRSALYKTKFF